MGVVVVCIFADAGRVGSVRRRQLARIDAVAAEALRARQVGGHAVGHAQPVVLSLAAQDLGGDDVFVILDHQHGGDRGQAAEQEAQGRGEQGEARAQRHGRAHAGTTSR